MELRKMLADQLGTLVLTNLEQSAMIHELQAKIQELTFEAEIKSRTENVGIPVTNSPQQVSGPQMGPQQQINPPFGAPGQNP